MEAILIISIEYTVAFTYLHIDVYLDIYVQFVENQCVKKRKIKRNCKKDNSTNENQNTLFLNIYLFLLQQGKEIDRRFRNPVCQTQTCLENSIFWLIWSLHLHASCRL